MVCYGGTCFSSTENCSNQMMCCFFCQIMAGGITRDTTEIVTSVVFKVEPRETKVWETWSSMGSMMRG